MSGPYPAPDDLEGWKRRAGKMQAAWEGANQHRERLEAQLKEALERAENAEVEAVRNAHAVYRYRTVVGERDLAEVQLASANQVVQIGLKALERIRGVIEYIRPHGFVEALAELDGFVAAAKRQLEKKP